MCALSRSSVMTSNAMFAEVASLAGDPARAGMLHALMDGRALTASELAHVAGITPEAASTLDNAISAYNRGCTGTQVMLAGHADRSGSATYNVGLSNRRNDAVRSYLTARGISDGSIGAQGFGETRPAVATADGVRNDQNRRVEITYGPNSR